MSDNNECQIKYSYSTEDKIKINKIKLNNIAAFILFKIIDKNININSLKSHLREFLLDFKDSLLAIELNFPVVAVFENIKESKCYTYLHELSGDQDWHRGDFSIVVSKDVIFEEISKESIPIKEGLSFKELSMKEIASLIVKQKKEIKERDKDFESFYIKFLETISENMVKGSVEECFQLWKNKIKKQLDELRGMG
ncbi:MAG: hypothetical protein Q9M37_00070 [Desulfonauticus sp.]|nr:hypothetical protein [Desulfonauticus sp.]